MILFEKLVKRQNTSYLSMEEHILNMCNKLRKRKDESALPYKLKACDTCTDATRQYYRDKQSVDYKENSHVQNVVQCILGCEWNLTSIV